MGVTYLQFRVVDVCYVSDVHFESSCKVELESHMVYYCNMDNGCFDVFL